jgi:hypothetical protein
VRLRTTILHSSEPEENSVRENGERIVGDQASTYHSDEVPLEELRAEALEQMVQEAEVKDEAMPGIPHSGRKRNKRLRRLLELSKSQKTTRILLQIWQSDYSIIAFVLVVASFYMMKNIGSPPIGLFFFILAMATVDAILSIFVVRLSFHQNKHGFYRTEDFERDWLRYRILLSMTKATLLFVVLTSCGTACVVASYIAWFFTATQRLRYIILRWSMDEHYPELQRWSIFALLREVGVEPRRKNFNLVAIIGVVIAFAIVFMF